MATSERTDKKRSLVMKVRYPKEDGGYTYKNRTYSNINCELADDDMLDFKTKAKKMFANQVPDMWLKDECIITA